MEFSGHSLVYTSEQVMSRLMHAAEVCCTLGNFDTQFLYKYVRSDISLPHGCLSFPRQNRFMPHSPRALTNIFT